MMGTFDEWQAQKDSQYILVTEYIEHLAREHSSSLFATVEYLQVNFSELKIYSKSFAGKFCIANTSLDNGFQRDFNAETVFIYIKDFLSINKKVDTLTFKENTTKFSHYYFKKSELPVIEPVKPSEPQASEINSQITLLQRDPLLTSLDDYSILEASCLISGDDFLEIERCYNDTNFDKNYAEYLRAERLISAGIKAKVLDLTRPSLQKFLKEKGYIIAGFNDKLPLAPADKIGHATITQTMPTDSQLSQQVADQQATIDQQAKEIAELKAQLASIEQTGKDTQSNTPAIVDKVLTGNSQSAVTKLIYSFMREHNYPLDGKHKGAVNEILQKLTNSYKVGIAEDTIAKWLKLVNELDQKLK